METDRVTLQGVASQAKCAAQHFGAWAIEPKWFASAMEAVRNGTLKPQPRADMGDDDDTGDEPLYTVKDGVAVICIDGQMTKRGSSFGGCSTVAVRQALRTAAKDAMVRAIVMHICSPGGTVAGTADLAEDVRTAREAKPVTAYIADMGCSAAYWVASQCERIYANRTAIIGSIGTYTVLSDDTKASDELGFKYTVVSTGEYKGLGADGAVSDKLVADVQREVNELNQPFLADVSAGRGKKIKDIAAVADGRAYVSEQAKTLGLIDEIASLDAAIEAVSNRSQFMTNEQFTAYAAEHPEAVAKFREEGRKAGVAEGRAEVVERLKANVEAAGNRPVLAFNATIDGKGPEDVKAIAAELDAEAKRHADALKAKDDEIAALKQKVEQAAFVAGTQGGVKVPAAAAPDKTTMPAGLDPKAQAEWEWDNTPAVRQGVASKDIYVFARAAELDGTHKSFRAQPIAS